MIDQQAMKHTDRLQEAIHLVPDVPGVYQFHSPTTCLYIGKSVNMRTRLLSHLRNPKAQKFIAQTHHIEFTATAGDIGAQLLEAYLIKSIHPLYNKKLRRVRRLYSYQLKEKPILVNSDETDFVKTKHLYGLFRTQTQGQDFLRVLADESALCYGRLGLEKLKPHQPCFRSKIKKCAGVCIGSETSSAHDLRLLRGFESLSVIQWPYQTPIGIVETHQSKTQIHVIDRWMYLGSADNHSDAMTMASAAQLQNGFDLDGYKILVRPLLNQEHKTIILDAHTV